VNLALFSHRLSAVAMGKNAPHSDLLGIKSVRRMVERVVLSPALHNTLGSLRNEFLSVGSRVLRSGPAITIAKAMAPIRIIRAA
jgi:hypothetical protein